MPKTLNFGVIGRSEWLYDTIAALLKEGHKLTYIITTKEAPEYKKTSNDFRILAQEHGVPFLEASNLSSDAADKFLRSVKNVNVVVSVNYSSIITDTVIDRYPLGILNAHGGDLPRYRGNACQAWAIVNGEKTVAMCIHRMIGGEVDSGNIISRAYLPISLDTKIRNIYDWFEGVIPQLFVEALGHLSGDPDYCVERQSKNASKALRCYPRRPEDARIDWAFSAEEIVRLVNASGDPYPGAFTFLEGRKVNVQEAGLHLDEEIFCSVPGQIVAIDRANSHVIVTTGLGKVRLKILKSDDGTSIWENPISTRLRFSSYRTLS